MPDFSDTIVVFADGRDSHVRGLVAGFAAAGRDSLIVPLERVTIATGGAGDPVRIPGLDGRLPRAAFVRTISAGSFEAVTVRLGILHALVASGCTVWNRPRAIEACVDKSMTSLMIARAGLPTPATWVTESRETAAAILAELGGPLVLKPLFGAQGKGLALVRDPAELPPPEAVAGLYYLQRFVGPSEGGFRDHRVLVSGGRVIAAMRRHGETWITNVHQGGRPEAWAADPAATELALAAAQAVGADLAGVDLIEDGAGGYMVLEVNSMPAWTGLQSVTAIDIAGRIAADLMAAAFGDAARP
ncbi:ATP-grasp domain-containing protein [Prosthecomicrobium hirschii]|uniref:ATP-grasp domain-containing protein n=1 Tax=Prosthecodimorpha hirschii TaxID=665126 RepID=UPI00221E6A33|nr:RimK family alpha-L-glutamate ligase [Prosthecomicrobium hirschii]